MNEEVHETVVGVHSVEEPTGSEAEVVEKGRVQKMGYV